MRCGWNIRTGVCRGAGKHTHTCLSPCVPRTMTETNGLAPPWQRYDGDYDGWNKASEEASTMQETPIILDE